MVDFISIMARLTEYSPSWVRMPERMAGMPQKVWRIPVTSPASIPASSASSMDSHTLVPPVKSTTNTDAPVQKEPSTDRSAISSSL